MEYLFTERAHLMCPGMCFGIAVKVKTEFNQIRVRRALNTLAGAHPFLNAFLGFEEENNKYFYDITDGSSVEINFMEEELSGLEALEIIKEFERTTGYDWDLVAEGMLKVSVWKMGKYTCFLLVFHHLLADGKGALNLAVELANLYADNVMPADAPEKLISSVNDLPKESRMQLINRMAIDRGNRDWLLEKRSPLSYDDYHEFAENFVQQNKATHFLKRIDKDELSRISGACRDIGVTINDYLLANMFIDEGTDKITIASDIRDKLGFYVPGSLGNYSTAFSVVVKKKTMDPFVLSKEVHKAVQKILTKPSDLFLVLQCYANLTPALLDAAFMAAKDGYKSRAASYIGKNVLGFGSADGYCITNLGKIECSSIAAAFFIPPASPAMKKTKGILTVNGKMMICTSER